MNTASGHWNDTTRALWRRISEHRFDHPGHRITFSARLAREHGWTAAEALAAIEEYRRFCFLACVAGQVVVPSDSVDEVWHQHLTDTRDYWQTWCPIVLGTDLHHVPSRGGADQDRDHRSQYAHTLASYECWFGPPSETHWPGTAERFAVASRYRRVDLGRNHVRPQRHGSRATVRIALSIAGMLALVLLAGPSAALSINPLDWNGPDFLGFYIVATVLANVVATVLRHRMRTGERRVPASTLGPYEFAYLAGGVPRVVDAAAAELMRRGLARWDEHRRIIEVQPRALDQEAPLGRIARALHGDGRVGDAIKRLEPMSDLRTTLERRGLLLDAEQAYRARLLPLLVPAAVLLLGVVKIAVGIARDKPVALLVILTVLAAIVLLVRSRPARTPLSRTGTSMLANARREHARAARAPREHEIALAVALAGTAVLSSTAYADYHQARKPAQQNDGSSCGSGGGGSDDGGSGGGGGGGCGGCGGGGGGGD